MSLTPKGTRSFVSLLIAAMLAACSSAGGGAPPIPGVQPIADGTARAGNATLVLRIRMPRRKKRRRGARYISPATQGMTMAFTGPSTFTQTINLTPSDLRCSGQPLICTIGIILKLGSYTATVNTYDEAPVSGAIPAAANLLSTAHDVAFTISAGVANQVGITLDGIPASISVGGFPPGASAGTAFSNKSFNVTAKDADGYVIAGTYNTPITLTDSDTSGATTIATTGSDDPAADELLSSSDTATISYTGRAITPITIGASAGAVSGSGTFAVQLPVFVGDSPNNAVKEIPPGCTSAACVTTLGGGFNTPEGVAVDESGNVYVADAGNNAVKEIPPGCTSAGCVTTLGGGFLTPTGVAVDGSGNVFVTDLRNNAVKKILSGCTSAGCVLTLGGGFNFPVGVAVDGSGNVFVSDTNNNALKKIPPGCFAAGCVSTVRTGFNEPTGIAVNGTDDVFLANSGNNAVDLVLHSCTKFCVIVLDGDFNLPQGVAVDGSGNVFVADTDNDVVKEFPAGCFTIGCATTLGGGFGAPLDVAVL